MSSVAIFGGGGAGLTVAHELGERGFAVELYERLDKLGGKSRSFGKPKTGVGGRADLPGEHGFRFFPGFYRHVPDTMKRIPLVGGGTVLDNLRNVPCMTLSFKDRKPVTLRSNIFDVKSPAEWAAALIDF